MLMLDVGIGNWNFKFRSDPKPLKGLNVDKDFFSYLNFDFELDVRIILLDSGSSL